MKFDSNDIWHVIPYVKVSHDLIPKDSIFRMCLDDFVYCWKAFPYLDVFDKRKRLSQIFNIDYFGAPIVLTNAVSFTRLESAMYYTPSRNDGTGFIYIYTFEDNILAGMYEQGFLWWRTRRYETKLKIGRTERNALRRIEEQLDCRTSISEPPILLAVFGLGKSYSVSEKFIRN